MAEYVVNGADPNETVLHSRTPNGYEAWHWLPVRERIVRCRDCCYFEADYSDGAMFEATVCWAWDNGHDYPSCTDPNGFCHRGEPKVVEPTTNDVGAEVDA